MTESTTTGRTAWLLEGLIGASSGAPLQFNIRTTPAPRGVPSVTSRGSVLYSKTYEACAADCRRELAIRKPPVPLSGNLLCVVEVIAAKPKAGKLAEPKGSIEDWAKGPLDAAAKVGIWNGDGQAVTAACSKRYAEPGEEPGIRLWVGTERTP